MILAIVIMAVLLGWFFLAKVTIYEISSELQFQEDGLIVATFPKEVMRRFEPGQPAILRINFSVDDKAVTLSALVTGTTPEQGQVELFVLSEEVVQVPFQEDMTGQVLIEIEYITPANLLRRASGRYLNNSQFPVSPQENEN